ncbi:MAG TPA: hypothetical protein VGH16_17875 [Candidatus Binatia bacterium]|jgi:hypothetical protein
MMKLPGVLMVSLFLASAAAAAGPKDYQVTGPVLDVNDDVITVQKGTEKWEIGRDKSTKIDGDLKKGARVTVYYKMNATKVDVKDAGKAKTETKSKTK